MPSKYKLIRSAPNLSAVSQPSFLDRLRGNLDEPALERGPWEARLRGLGAGAIEGAQALGKGLVESVKHPMTAAPAVIRAGSALASSEGLLPGALISGGGELAAEGLEGSLWKQSPLRSLLKVGTASGIGTVPLAATLRAGKVGTSMGRSAAYAGGGELARELSGGEGIDPTKIGTSTVIGGTTGGILGKLLGLSGTATAGKEAAQGFRRGEEYLPTYPTREAYQAAQAAKLPKEPPLWENTQSVPGTGAAYYPEQETYAVPGTESGRVQKIVAKETAASEKEQAARMAQRAIEKQISKRRLVEEQPKINRTIVPGGTKLSSRTPLVKQRGAPPENTAAGDAYDEAILAGQDHKAAIQHAIARLDVLVNERTVPPVVPETPLVTPEPLSEAPVTPLVPEAAPAGASPLTRFFRSRADAAGQNYAEAKAAVGENPLAVRQAGAALQQETANAGLPTRGTPNLEKFLTNRVSPDIGSLPQAEAGAGAPAMMNQSGSGSKRASSFLDQLKKSVEAQPPVEPPAVVPDENSWIAEQLAEVARRARGEKGEVTMDFPTRLASGGLGALIGAPIGASMSDEEHKGRGAAAGAVLGGGVGFGGIPAANALSKVNREALGSGIKTAIETIPKWQRFSLLTSNPNSSLANIFAGPWGSGIVMALEKGLSGDPRGWTLLKKMLNVKQLGKNFGQSLLPAEQIIGRAEGEAIGANPTLPQHILSGPGTTMTAGDMAVRKPIIESGFTDKEARRATLTSEPELFAFKKLADLGKGKPANPKDLSKALLEMSFPFKRTPANIGEQGALRFPGLGVFFQKMREHPDPWKEQVWQQLMNAGIGAGSYAMGESLDPETAKTVRKYVTNAAGPHSTMASAGFVAGQAHRAGREAISGKTLQEFADALPLPTHQALLDWLKLAAGLPKGELNIPKSMIPLRNTNLSVPPGLPISSGTSSKYKLIKP